MLGVYYEQARPSVPHFGTAIMQQPTSSTATSEQTLQCTTPPPPAKCQGFEPQFTAYTSSFSSVVMDSIDWRFYCSALRAGTDKVTTHSYQVRCVHV